MRYGTISGSDFYLAHLAMPRTIAITGTGLLIPWSVPVAMGLPWLGWRYAGAQSPWPRSCARRMRRRANAVSLVTLKWSLLANAPRGTGSPPPLQREAFVQRYLSVDCIDPHRIGQHRIVVDERAVFRQRDHRKHQRAPFESSGEGLADLGIPIGGRCHVSHNYLAR
jgi:hypothetical protein